MKRCMIVGAGEIEISHIMHPQKEDYVIAADGGFEVLQEAGIVPHVWIGDMDSTRNNGCENSALQQVQVIKLPREKDDTDMLAAIRMGLEQGCQEFLLYGSLGGRLDHTIANIQCLLFLKKHGANGRLYGKTEIVEVLQNETRTYPADMKGTISVFALEHEAKGVTEKGLKYEIEDAVLSSGFPIGVSNEFIGCESQITVREGTLLICMMGNA